MGFWDDESTVDYNVTFTGDWEEFDAWLNWMKRGGYRNKLARHMDNIGKAVRRQVRHHILAQDLNWAELSDYTKKKKGHDKAYIDTGTYLENIHVETQADKDGAETIIYPDADYPDGTSLQEFASVLEYGSSKIKSRPLWSPVLEEARNFDEVRNFPLDEIFSKRKYNRKKNEGDE